jgi:autotransporter adhesin
MALGRQAQATGISSVALGSSSVATESNTVSVGASDDPRRIVNVAAGQNAQDAVNVSQLRALGLSVNQLAEDLSKSTLGAASAATAPSATAIGSGAVASGTNSVALGSNSVADRSDTVSVGSPGNERTLSNVAAGSYGTDAVNISQFQQESTKTITGIAATAALIQTAVPPYKPGKIGISVGVASYRGYGGVAIGRAGLSESGGVAYSLGVGTAQGQSGAVLRGGLTLFLN